MKLDMIKRGMQCIEAMDSGNNNFLGYRLNVDVNQTGWVFEFEYRVCKLHSYSSCYTISILV